jgi:hypothetical protein
MLWQFLIDVSGQRIGPIFKGQESTEVSGQPSVLLLRLTLEDETERLSRKVGKELPIHTALIAQKSAVLICFSAEA